MKILIRLFSMAVCLFCVVSSAEAKKEKIPCQIHVTTEPEDTTIFCDGVSKGAAPITISDLRPGRHLIVAKKKGFNDARHSIVLKESQKQAVDLKLDPTVTILIVHSNPMGAAVQIDGADRGKTPLLITDMPLGKHRLIVSYPGHVAKEIEINIKDRTPQKTEIDLTTDSAKVALSSTPSGAKVTLNGVSKGTTPCTLDRVPNGTSRLELSLEGYEPYKETLKLSAGQSESLRAVLVPIPSSLTIVSIPTGARIYVDNEFKGNSPVTLKNLTPGSFRIRAELPAHKPMARTVKVELADDPTEEFRFESNSGLLKITTEPSGANIFVDSKKSGTTEAKAQKTDQVSEPLVIDLLEAGSHQVTVSKPGYYDKKFNVVIEVNGTKSQHVQLRRRFIPNYEIRTSQQTYTGFLVKIDPIGDVTMETRPGVFKTFSKKDILIQRPLREDKK